MNKINNIIEWEIIMANLIEIIGKLIIFISAKFGNTYTVFDF